MSVDGDEVLLVISTLPDWESAERFARDLIEARVAACVNMLAPCVSVYRWQGTIEDKGEIPVLIKTTARRYEQLESKIRELHPYELPEILAVPVTRGLPGYLGWVAAETA
ncbi:MAG: divalent-cation tolerance protein CutA [Burkholderiales bacterium]